jgi:hypothetical protein
LEKGPDLNFKKGEDPGFIFKTYRGFLGKQWCQGRRVRFAKLPGAICKSPGSGSGRRFSPRGWLARAADRRARGDQRGADVANHPCTEGCCARSRGRGHRGGASCARTVQRPPGSARGRVGLASSMQTKGRWRRPWKVAGGSPSTSCCGEGDSINGGETNQEARKERRMSRGSADIP